MGCDSSGYPLATVIDPFLYAPPPLPFKFWSYSNPHPVQSSRPFSFSAVTPPISASTKSVPFPSHPAQSCHPSPFIVHPSLPIAFYPFTPPLHSSPAFSSDSVQSCHPPSFIIDLVISLPFLSRPFLSPVHFHPQSGETPYPVLSYPVTPPPHYPQCGTPPSLNPLYQSRLICYNSTPPP